MSLVIKVKEILDAAILKSRNHHLQTHKIEERVADKDTSCVHCKKPIPRGAKILLCTSASELDDSVAMPKFCSQACHDEWIQNDDVFRTTVMYWVIIPQMCQAQAFVDVFKDMFHRVEVNLQGGEGFRKLIQSIELPIIFWVGVELTSFEREYWDSLYNDAKEICRGAILNALSR